MLTATCITADGPQGMAGLHGLGLETGGGMAAYMCVHLQRPPLQSGRRIHLSGFRQSSLLWLPTGIWTRDLKSRTNLQQAQITKVLKQLETRRLVKSIRPVSEPSKKFYISFDIEPSTEITGGAWWVAALPRGRAALMKLRSNCLHHAVLLALPPMLGCLVVS